MLKINVYYHGDYYCADGNVSMDGAVNKNVRGIVGCLIFDLTFTKCKITGESYEMVHLSFGVDFRACKIFEIENINFEVKFEHLKNSSIKKG